MDTVEFLQHVLPAGGLKVLAELVPRADRGKPRWRYTTYRSFAAMAEAIQQIDATGRTIYHACNGFGDWYQDAEGKKRLRTSVNAVACRSLYDDLDVEVGNPCKYDSKAEAGAALKAFIAATGLPAPTIINSGGGLHLYWSLTEDITPARWLELAEMKRAVARRFGLRTDPAVDVDLARVLRPVGSTWRKEGEHLVKAIHVAPPVTEAALATALGALLPTPAADEALLPEKRTSRFAVTSDLVAADYPPSSLAVIARHCRQIALFRDTGGETEPVWYAALGVAKHCTDGEALAHEWSAKYAGYTEAETQGKLDHWTHGPTTCARFKSLNPDACNGCKHTCISPIALGATAHTQAPLALDAEPKKPGDHNPADYWPADYRATESGIEAAVTDDEGVVHWVEFVRPAFSVLYRYDEPNSNGIKELGYRVQCRLNTGDWREFDIANRKLNDARSFTPEFSGQGVMFSNPKLGEKFMREYHHKAKAMPLRESFEQFGWQHEFNSFFIGDTLITRGAPIPARASRRWISETSAHVKAWRPKGSIEDWVDGVDTLYNVMHGEPYQYAIATGFGSVLVAMIGGNEWRGIPLALTSAQGGRGKSTVCKIALNIYADHTKLDTGNATPKALIGTASNLNHLPMLVDETTKTLPEPADIAEVVYALANGHPRIAMTREGKLRDTAPPWSLLSFITDNRSITQTLNTIGFNPDGLQSRVFEIMLDDYPKIPTLDTDTGAEIAERTVNNTACVVGLKYLRIIMANRAKIEAYLQRQLLDNRAAIREAGGDISRDRFYIYHLTCAMVGAKIAKSLKLIHFDLDNLREWAINHIMAMRRYAAEYSTSIEEQFSQMVSDMNGHLIVTRAYNTLDVRAGRAEAPLVPIRGDVRGRLILGQNDGHERGRGYLARPAIVNWCKEKKINPLQFLRDLATAKLAVQPHGDNHRYLAKGVPTVTAGNPRVLEVPLSALQGFIDANVGDDNIVKFPTPPTTEGSEKGEAR